MQGPTEQKHKDDFAARLARVHASRNPGQVINPVEDPSGGTDAAQPLPRLSTTADEHASSAGPVTILLALILGLIAVTGARYARYMLLGEPLIGSDPMLTMMIDAGVAAVFAFAFGLIVHLSHPMHEVAKLLGIGAMVVGMHNLVHLAPEPFAIAFSDAWTQEVLTTTEFSTVLLGEQVFLLPLPVDTVAASRAEVTAPVQTDEILVE